MKKQKKNQNLIFVLLSILIIILIYFVICIVRFFRQPADTVLIKNGEVIKYEEVVGYIIRNEKVLDTSSYEGTPKANVDDATKVSKGTEIIAYMSREKEQLTEKIAKLDNKIQEAMESKQTILPNDVKVLDSEIEIYLYTNIKENNDVYSIYESKNLINEKIEKKAKIAGDLSPVGSQLKSLIEERTSYEKQINDSEKSLKTPEAGLVSFRVDNYENVLSPSVISKLTLAELEKIKINNNQIIPISPSKVKIVNNFECYIAIPMKSEESKEAKLNDNIYLRFDNTGDEFINATIEYISEEDDKRIIVLKIKSNVEELTKYRKINLDVVWWRDKGLKINKEAITYSEITGISGDTVIVPKVTIKKSSYTQDVFAKIVREAGDFAIITNYEDKELLNLGVPEELIAGRQTLKMYDEAVLIKNKM